MLNILKKIFSQSTILKNFYHLKYKSLPMIYEPSDLNDDYYGKIKNLGDKELEHQIGRLNNFQKIIREIERDGLQGDFIEFGCWKGFSLLWIGYIKERFGLLDRKLIGVDGFVGLPNSEGVFEKGAFVDTSWKMCREHVKNSKLYDISKKNIYVEKFLYSQKEEIIKRFGDIGSKKFCFIHIDCDISSSVREIFSILTEGDLLADKCFLLFDDYGVVASYQKTVDDIIDNIGGKWQVVFRSSTKLTKNFCLLKR